MKIPIRATFLRAEKPGGEAKMIDAVYAEVPDALVLGTAAQASVSLALHAGDEENALRISRALDRACADGKLMTMD